MEALPNICRKKLHEAAPVYFQVKVATLAAGKV
jgi:hypothetical protein